jgi:hypothetical protein
MRKDKAKTRLLRTIFLGKRYSQLRDINEQVRYATMNSIFMAAIIPLIVLGLTNIGASYVRAIVNFSIALSALFA